MSTFTDVNKTAVAKKPKYFPKTSFMYAQEEVAAKAAEEAKKAEEAKSE